MTYKIDWKIIATYCYNNETDFILAKWNEIKVKKFEILIYDFLAILSKYSKIGIFKFHHSHKSLAIVKQTTSYYKMISDSSQIDLILFCKYKQNLIYLTKLLH